MEGLGQPGAEQRLIDEGVNSRRPCLPLDIRPVVGGKNDDGNFLSHRRTNGPRGGDAIHVRHFPVQNAGIIVFFLLMPPGNTLHRLPAGRNALGFHAEVRQNADAGFQRIGVIVRHQHRQIHPVVRLNLPGILQLQVHGHRESGAHALFTFHLDIAAHHAHDVAADGHAKARALNLSGGAVRLSGEGLKDPVDEFLAHAEAVVLKDELIAPQLLLIAGLFRHGNADFAAVGGELHRIAQKVREHLLNPQAVAHHRFVLNVCDVDTQAVIVISDLCAGHGDQIVDEVRKVKRLLHQLHLAGLDLAHVQHLVNEAQQVLAGKGDLLQAVPHPGLIVNVGGGNGGHADDAVHGGADVVGHIGQELGLGPVGGFRRVVGLLQRLLLQTFLFDEVIHVAGTHHRGNPPVLVRHKGHPCLKIHDSLRRPLFIGKGVIRSAAPKPLQRQHAQEVRSALLRNPLLGVAVQPLGPAAVVPAEVLLDGPAVLVFRPVCPDRISEQIHQQHGIVLRCQAVDDLPLGLHLPGLPQLATGLLVHVPDAQNKGDCSVVIDGFHHVHLKKSDHSVHIPPVAGLVQAHLRHPPQQALEAGGLPDARLILRDNISVYVSVQHLFIVAGLHESAQKPPVHADAVGAVKGNGALFRIDLEQTVVLPAQSVNDGHFFLKRGIGLLHLRQGVLQHSLLRQLLPLFLVHILEGHGDFPPLPAGPGDVTLEVLDAAVPANPELEGIALPLLGQLLQPLGGCDYPEQLPVIGVDFVLEIFLHIPGIASLSEASAVALQHGAAHSVAGYRVGVQIHGINVVIGHGQGQNQVVLGFLPLPFRRNLTHTHDHRTVEA